MPRQRTGVIETDPSMFGELTRSIPRRAPASAVRWRAFAMDALVSMCCIVVAWSLCNMGHVFSSLVVDHAWWIAAVAGVWCIRLAAIAALGMYAPKYVGLGDATYIRLAMVSLLGSFLLMICAWICATNVSVGLFVILEAVLTASAIIGWRRGIRWQQERRQAASAPPTLIIGCTDAARIVVDQCRRTGQHRIAGVVDCFGDNRGGMFEGNPVVGTLHDLSAIVNHYHPQSLILAAEGLPPSATRKILKVSAPCGLRVLRAQEAITSGKKLMQLTDIQLADLLGRTKRSFPPFAIHDLLSDQVVLVTGAGGSIGSEICRQVLLAEPKSILLMEKNEPSLYHIEMQLREMSPAAHVVGCLTDASDERAVEAVFAAHHPTVIIHAAAYKHVPIVELNPLSGIANNVGAFVTIRDAALRHHCRNLVLVSTDKAVNPTNVMGATKRVCELLLHEVPNGKTVMNAVRFGNVLGSSGSVVPRFLAQIGEGGPVTVTHKDITRYFMLIPEAVELVLHSATVAKHGDLMVLDMGDPVRIDDLARQLILMLGHTPDGDIAIEYCGLRPGEKLYEELLINNQEKATAIDGLMIASQCHGLPRQPIRELLTAANARDIGTTLKLLKRIVPEWTMSESIQTMIKQSTKRKCPESIDEAVCEIITSEMSWHKETA